MSYCRFSEGDVYMYSHIYGYIDCCGCSLAGKTTTKFNSRMDAINHLQLHIMNGDKVPERAIKRLEEEIKEVGDAI